MLKKNTNEIKHTAHSSYRCQYHIVFAPKFRRQEFFEKMQNEKCKRGKEYVVLDRRRVLAL